MDGGAWWAAVHGVLKSQTRLSDFTFTFHFHALEKEMATHFSVLAWRIPGTEWWWGGLVAAIYGVAQSRTRLKQLSSSSTSSSIFISMILSQFIPPSPYPTVSTDLFLCLASLFLPCKIGSIFLNRFHIYVLT